MLVFWQEWRLTYDWLNDEAYSSIRPITSALVEADCQRGANQHQIFVVADVAKVDFIFASARVNVKTAFDILANSRLKFDRVGNRFRYSV